MDADIPAAAFRDEVLRSVTSISVRTLLAMPAERRHRCALAVLREWGLAARWRATYGRRDPIEHRLREVLLVGLREHDPPARLLVPRSSSIGDVVAFDPARAVRTLSRIIEGPTRAIQRALAPLADAARRASDWLAAVLAPIRRAMDDLVKRPLVRSAADLLSSRAAAPADGRSPMELLLGLHRKATVARSPNNETARNEDTSVEPNLVIPDEASLIDFYARELGDPRWQRGPAAWLLRALPVSLGARVHEMFLVSSEAALAWLAERLLRRELKRALEPALEQSGCAPTTRSVLLAGIEHYMREEWDEADTLLTAGLDGLVLELAVRREVLTPSHKLRRAGSRPGRRVTTGGDSAVLAQMGFDSSQIQYLTSLSLGPTGNAPRHGQESPLGSSIHAAGSLLGLLLVLNWLDAEDQIVARALLAA